MKFVISQITTDPGQIESNKNKIIREITRARESKIELVIFPELALPGYGILDLAFSENYIRHNLQALQEIASYTREIAVVLGFIELDNKNRRPTNRPSLYNSAAFIKNGIVDSIHRKTLLPDYDIFFENRYFTSGKDRTVVQLNGETLGIQICEDLWDSGYNTKVTEDLVKLGANTIINISASPFNCGKLKERENLIKAAISKFRINFLYANSVGSFDGFEGEVVFDGNSRAYGANGQLIAAGCAFNEDFISGDTSSFEIKTANELSEAEEVIQALILGIREYFRRLNLKHAYIGLSGGIDSALVAWLAREALGNQNVTTVTMPSHITSSETLNDAEKLAANLGLKCIKRPIISEYEAWEKEFIKINGKPPISITRQNKQARLRGSILMEYTNETPASIVISTGNKTELALGYCTLYGDMCGGLAAISDLSKTRVYLLANTINERAGYELIPNSIINRIPSAELEVGQEDRHNLPADYPILSPLVDELIENSTPFEDLASHYPAEVIEKTWKLICNNEFKRRQAAPGIRVTRQAFGIGRRIPMGLNSVRY